jgi:hypothetical protein
MAWAVEISDAFEAWWDTLDEDAQVSVDAMLRVLEVYGAALGPPYSVGAAANGQLRELRVPHAHAAFTISYVCDPWRASVVLLSARPASVREPDRCAA